jgi:hypothetical protein
VHAPYVDGQGSGELKAHTLVGSVRARAQPPGRLVRALPLTALASIHQWRKTHLPPALWALDNAPHDAFRVSTAAVSKKPTTASHSHVQVRAPALIMTTRVVFPTLPS